MDFIPITEDDKAAMLKFLGLKSVDELFDLSIPDEVRLRRPLSVPDGSSEYELIRHIRELATDNRAVDDYVSFLGGGMYDHFVPKIVDAIVSLPEYYTPYTPYQPEASQGILQALFEYQTMICELTGMDVTNDSLYDGATALAEAALMALDVTGKSEVIVSEAVHPEYRDVLATYTKGLGVTIKTAPIINGQTDMDALADILSADTSSVIIQHPNFFGCLEDMPRASEIITHNPALFITCVDPISLGILKPPAAFGADIVVGEGQALGNKMNFGGPGLGIFACKQEYIRRVPGRITSATTDTEGRTGYVLTLQTREQHIRREKATSNITTSEVLNAIAATVYLSYLGPQGIKDMANLCLQRAHYAYEHLQQVDYIEPFSEAPFFKEFTVLCNRPIEEVNMHLFNNGILGGVNVGRFYPDYKNAILLCVTEKRTKQEIDNFIEVMQGSNGYDF